MMAHADTTTYVRMLKTGRDLRANTRNLPECKLAVLADHATQQFTHVLRAALVEQGFYPDIYEAEYATAALESFDRDSGLHRFRPQAIVLSLCMQKYRDRFFDADTPQQREDLPHAYVREIEGILDALEDDKTTIVVNNFVIPIERQFGNFSLQTAQSIYGSVRAFNNLLMESVSRRRNCIINDVAYISSLVGVRNFLDERL